MKAILLFSIILTAVFAFILPEAYATLPMPRAPHFQYFEKPRLRFPYYDEFGRGRILYGYGGNQLYRYSKYSYLEGIY